MAGRLRLGAIGGHQLRQAETGQGHGHDEDRLAGLGNGNLHVTIALTAWHRDHGGLQVIAAAALRQVIGDELADLFVAGAGRIEAEGDHDDVATILAGGGQQIGAGGVDVAGLDAVDGAHIAQHAVVVTIGGLAVAEAAGLEEFVIAREVLVDGDSQDRLVAHRSHLATIGQARGVAIGGVAHAQRTGGGGHALGELGFGA